MRWLVILLLILPQMAWGATSAWVSSERDQVRLVTAGPGRAALEFLLRPGWHIYWRNPGEAGFAPIVSLAAPAQAGALQFPAPELLQLGPVTDYVLSGRVVLPFSVSGAGPDITAQARWLVCRDVCVPEHASFTLAMDGTDAAGPVNLPQAHAATLSADGVLRLPGVGPVRQAHFFPYAPGVLKAGAAQKFWSRGGDLWLRIKPLPGAGAADGVVTVLRADGSRAGYAIRPVAAAEAGRRIPWAAFLSAFLGGLILNLMPCVFPVLALKAVSVCRLGAGSKIRHEAAGYAGGVLVSMAVLGGILILLRGLGIEAGWGFQFQSPFFVAVVAWILLVAALSFAGLVVFQAPAMVGRVPAQHSFATGALAVAVATPCSAPFMAGAIAAALAAPWWVGMGVFLLLGLGLATPILLLAAVPGLARFIPRPGAWMVWLQRVLAVPMAATFLWLGWVLYRQTGWVGVLVLGAGGVWLGVTLARPRWRIAALAVILVLPLLRFEQPAAALTLPGAQTYTPERLAALRAAGRPVLVDLTAAWCVTCLVNEATTLKNPSVRAAMRAHDVALLVGDWTDKNPDISALLAANHRDGVPLYLYFAPGAKTPKILPQVLQPSVVKRVAAGS